MDQKIKQENYQETFQLFKNIIISQNEIFLKDLAKKFNKNPDDLIKKYIRQDYYLPIIDWNNNSDSLNNTTNKKVPKI